MSADTTRRGLMSTAIAGLVVGAAAPRALAANPDIALLELCATYDRAHTLAVSRLGGKTDAEDRAFNKARAGEWVAFEAVAKSPPAITDAGRLAKARVAVTMTEHIATDDLDPEVAFCRNVLAEMIGLPGAPAEARRDVELVTACTEALQVEADYTRLCWSTDQQDPRHQVEDGAAAEAAFDRVCERQEVLLRQIAKTPAVTREGLQGKAAVILAFFGPSLPEEGLPIGDVLGSLLRDAAEWRT